MSGNIVENRVVILSACPVSPQMRSLLRPDDYIIACDAGYRNAEPLGCRPRLILGDFDSAPCPEFPDIVVLPHIKDDTDTQYAAQWAVLHGAREVLMLGALGGIRMEHTLANLCTGLYLAKNGVAVEIADEHSSVRYFSPEKKLVIERENWDYFSVFPMEGILEGLSIQGAFYPLENAELKSDYPLGVSNEFTEPEVTVLCRSGWGIVVCTKE